MQHICAVHHSVLENVARVILNNKHAYMNILETDILFGQQLFSQTEHVGHYDNQ